MKSQRALRLASTLSLATLLTACASGPNVSGSWKEIATANNGNIKAYVDTNSIQRQGSFATFRDKKTIIKTDQERYINTPHYKTAVGTWQINCNNKTYRLTTLQLLDKNGQVLSNNTYTATDVRPMSIMDGSITAKQYEVACGRKL